MSTVSGGGYIGCSLTAALEWTHRQDWTEETFPFTSRLKEDEPPSLQHIRDYSNYLFPNGAGDLLRMPPLCARACGQCCPGGAVSAGRIGAHTTVLSTA